MHTEEIQDDKWLHIISNPHEYNNSYNGIILPNFVEDKLQRKYTGQTGQDNLNQAFNFYSYCRDKAALSSKSNPKVMDFGAGWSRVIRFYLRDTAPENLYAVDVMQEAVDLMKKVNFTGNIVKCNSMPEIPDFEAKGFDLIYALSVFSHLSEEAFIGWMKYFRKIVGPEGRVVFSTRGLNFLEYLKRVKDGKPESEWPRYLSHMGDLDDVIAKYNSGEFIFIPSFGGNELSDSFFGEAYISKEYLISKSREIGFKIQDSTSDIKKFSQMVFTLESA